MAGSLPCTFVCIYLSRNLFSCLLFVMRYVAGELSTPIIRLIDHLHTTSKEGFALSYRKIAK